MLHAGAIGAEGRFMADLLRESGADTSLLREVDGPSGHAVIEISAAGQNRIIVFGGANRSMTSEYIERVLDTAQPDDWVLLQNEVNLVPEIIRRAHEKGLRVVFNPSPVPENTEKLPLACVSLFMVNEIEAAQLAGTDANADFEDTLTALRAKYPNASVVMTVGADGVLYDGEEGRFQLPAFKVKAVDTTAAGDTFCGYFLAAVSAEGNRCRPRCRRLWRHPLSQSRAQARLPRCRQQTKYGNFCAGTHKSSETGQTEFPKGVYRYAHYNRTRRLYFLRSV